MSNFKQQSKLSLIDFYYILISSNFAMKILFVLGLIWEKLDLNDKKSFSNF